MHPTLNIMTESHVHTIVRVLCEQKHARKKFGSKRRTTSYLQMMHSVYPKEKEPIYFQMTKVDVATVLQWLSKLF